ADSARGAGGRGRGGRAGTGARGGAQPVCLSGAPRPTALSTHRPQHPPAVGAHRPQPREVPMPPSRHVLILGGPTEARRLAEALHADPPCRGLRVTTSLAGRVARPARLPGEVRIGGFGGAGGMARWLREHRVDALVDATHPFAGTISFHAATAAADARVPL